MEIKDILNLLGNELKDNSEQPKRFREFIEQDKWSIQEVTQWLDECIDNSSGAHDPHNRAFQDLVISLGNRLGFEIEYGRYVGKAGENNHDGIWKRKDTDQIILEVKTSTWPIGSITQLGEYVENVAKQNDDISIFGLYVIGKGNLQPVVEQILGSKYKDRIRIIHYKDLLEIIDLKDTLELTTGKQEAINQVQNILLPIESINIGNIVRIILEIAKTKSKTIEQGEPKKEPESKTKYDKAFYTNKRNSQSVDYFYKYVKEVEDLIVAKGWALETKFNRNYISYAGHVRC